jgi:hypothetical protein
MLHLLQFGYGHLNLPLAQPQMSGNSTGSQDIQDIAFSKEIRLFVWGYIAAQRIPAFLEYLQIP